MKQSCAIFLRMQNESRCHFIDEEISVNPMIAIEHKRAGSNDYWTVARINRTAAAHICFALPDEQFNRRIPLEFSS